MYFLKTDYLLQYLLLHVNGYSQCLKVRLLSWQGVVYIIMHQQSEGREPDRVEWKTEADKVESEGPAKCSQHLATVREWRQRGKQWNEKTVIVKLICHVILVLDKCCNTSLVSATSSITWVWLHTHTCVCTIDEEHGTRCYSTEYDVYTFVLFTQDHPKQINHWINVCLKVKTKMSKNMLDVKLFPM